MSSPFDEGTHDFLHGTGQLTNPYPVGTPQYNDYERGWVQALKRSPTSAHTPHSFAREPGTPQFGATFPAYEAQVDPEEEKKRAARDYARATGR